MRAITCNFWLGFFHSLDTRSLNVKKLSIFIPSNFSDMLVFIIKLSKFKLDPLRTPIKRSKYELYEELIFILCFSVSEVAIK